MSKLFIISSVILGKRGSIGERFEHIILNLQKSKNFDEVHVVGKNNFSDMNFIFTSLPSYFILIAALKRIEKRFGINFYARRFELNLFARWAYRFCNKHVSSSDLILSQELIPFEEFNVYYDVSILPECLVEEFICVEKRVKCGQTVNFIRLASFLKNAKGVFVPSSYIVQRMNSFRSSGKLFLVPFAGMKYELKLLDENNGKNIYFFGDLSRRKGIDNLFELAQILESSGWTIHLYGRPSRLYHTLKRTSVSNNILCYGHKALELESFSRGYYVFPSYLEGSSKSLYDALNIGFPILTSPMSGLPNEALGEYCFEVNTFDMSVWASLLLELHDNGRHLDSEKIRELGSNFTWSRYGSSVVEVLEDDIDY